MVVATLERSEKKVEVMRKKKELKNTKIYINNDLTKEESRVLSEILKIAQEKRGKGHAVYVRYKKITIDGEE